MKNILLIFSFFGFGFFSYGQVGIGTTLPNPSAQLDIVSENTGILIPRVSLTGVTDVTTISNGNVESLLVYNLSTKVDLQPGYYYWSKGRWQRIATSGEGNNGNNITDSKVKMIDNGNGTYSFTNNDGTVINIKTSGTGGGILATISLSPDNKYLNYTDEKGNTTKIDLGKSVKSLETLTSLTKNADGSFTYINEAGTAVTIEGFAMQATNGLNQNGQNIEFGGTLTKPTQIVTSTSNTFAIQGMQPGDVKDNYVVTDPKTGVLKYLPASSLNGERKVQVYTASENQNIYTTPFLITNKDKVQVFRNGVEIDFEAAVGDNTITLDFSKYVDDNIKSCFSGDEIKIFQWK